MLMAFATWLEIEAQLERSKTVIVPIGSNEQHGPTGLLGTDWLCPEIIAHEAQRHMDQLLVAPTFNIGMAQHHLAFPGTISLRPSTFQAAIRDWIGSLHRQGFERIYFLNGHGGNVAAIEASFAETYADWSFAGLESGLTLDLVNWWDLPGIKDYIMEMFPEGHGSHATPSEIAVTQGGYPDSVRTAVLEPRIAACGPIREALDYRRRFPDGRIGSDPSQASPEKGRLIINKAATALIGEFQGGPLQTIASANG